MKTLLADLNSGNTCYHSIPILSSSCLLSGNLIKIFTTIILTAVFYGCEIWSLTLKEEHRLRMFENRVLRIFGSNREELTGKDNTTRSFITLILYRILLG
jgi:dolichol kinase